MTTEAKDRRVDSAPGANRRAEARSVIVVSPDAALRQRLASSLAGLRWKVREAAGGAQAVMLLEARAAQALLVDHWLPDLEVGEFAEYVRLQVPEMEVLPLDGERSGEGDGRAVSPRRNELLYAMREALDFEGEGEVARLREADAYRVAEDGSVTDGSLPARRSRLAATAVAAEDALLPGLIGGCPAMREVARLVRLVAPRSTSVLIEGETGTGKEVVARALHRLSPRADKPFAVLNCAAIPESLLEAELFGHTRGAFTGAVQSRMGRIEMANGGTLLLDEIGEMPIAMQAKMLRFLESGELQRVGDNEVTRVDVRLIAATHQPLERRSDEGTFRLDLYHRLAVFPVEVPPLRERVEDIAELAEYFLERLGRDSLRKRLAEDALARLQVHTWPGNVRELMHVLERAVILACANPEIAAAEIRYRRATRSGS
jgi:DNA-binding NtrC family response regulator